MVNKEYQFSCSFPPAAPLTERLSPAGTEFWIHPETQSLWIHSHIQPSWILPPCRTGKQRCNTQLNWLTQTFQGLSFSTTRPVPNLEQSYNQPQQVLFQRTAIHVVLLHGVSCLLNEQPGYWNTQKPAVLWSTEASRMLVGFDISPAQIRARRSGKRTLQAFLQSRHISFSISNIPRDALTLCKYGPATLGSCFLSTSH